MESWKPFTNDTKEPWKPQENPIITEVENGYVVSFKDRMWVAKNKEDAEIISSKLYPAQNYT